jgi:thiosulfate/3-mercaptopyruvate sulfurtransferase
MTTPTPWVSPAELAHHLIGSDTPWCLLDTRFDLLDPSLGERSFAAGHVPGAQYLHLDHDLARERTANEGRHPLPARAVAAARFAAAGVDVRQTVVVMDAGNALFAARAWWMLRELGHSSVRVLAGGFAAWQAAGLPVASGPAAVPVPGSFIPAEPTLGFGTVDADLLWDELQRGACALDARAADRYAGLNEPIDPVAGHIPGARNLPYGALLQTDGTLLPAPLLREKIAAALAGTPAENALLYCGSGVTACALHLAFTTANLAGTSGPRVYPGSWSEWCRQPERPVATGATP